MQTQTFVTEIARPWLVGQISVLETNFTPRCETPGLKPTWNIRAASAADAALLADLAERTFRAAFGEGSDPEQMDRYCAQAFTDDALRNSLESEAMVFFIAETPEGAVAYAQLCFGEAPPCVQGPDPAQLKRIYLDRAFHGSGLASDLLRRVCEEAAARGSRTLWLTVWEENPRAIRFYERCGFTVTGEADFFFGTEIHRDLVMDAPLASVRT